MRCYIYCLFLFPDRQFGLSEEKIGLVFMAGPGVYMLLALLFGGLADKFVSTFLPQLF